MPPGSDEVPSVPRLAFWRSAKSSGTVLRNARWMLFGQGLSLVFQGAYFLLLGRLLGSTEYGIYAGAFSTVSVLSQYSSLGSQWLLLKYVSQERKAFAVYWGNVLLTTFSLGSLLILASIWLGSHLAHTYGIVMLLCVASSECICAQLTSAAGRAFQAFEKMQLTAGLNLLVNFLRAVTAAILFARQSRASATEWAVASLIVSAIAACVALVLVRRALGKPFFSTTLFRSRLGEGAVFAVSYSTTGVYNDIDKSLLGHYGLNAANGIYTLAYRIIDVATIPAMAVQGAAFPQSFRMGLDGIRRTTAYAVHLVKRTAPLTLACGLAVTFAGTFIPRLVGRSFNETSLALFWLCPLPFFRSFQLAAGDALTAAGFQRLRLLSQAVAAVLNFAVNLYLIPRYSWRGAAAASLITDGLIACTNWALAFWLVSSAKGSESAHPSDPLSTCTAAHSVPE